MIDAQLLLQIVAVLLFFIGLVIASNPELVRKKPIPDVTHEAIQRRVWAGFLVGFGCLFFFHHQLLPWALTAKAVVFMLTAGVLTARLIGIVLDGSVVSQWVRVGIEALVVLVSGYLYFSQLL